MKYIIDICFVYVIPILAYFFAAWFNTRYFIHMFQLNSYKPKVQTKWVLKNSKKFLYLHLGIVVAEIILWTAVFVTDNVVLTVVALCVSPVLLIVSGLANLPKKSYKTPLKYTNRVVRMCITTMVIFLIPAVLAAVINRAYSISLYGLVAKTFLSVLIVDLIMPVMVALTPWIVLLANLINRPLELAVNRHYINDAKRILKECPDLTVVGITGSFGKTSVKYFLDTLLSVKYNVLKTPGNFNTPLGVVRTIRDSLRATHQIFLCEMGAKNVGDIKEICDIVHPKHGIITSVGQMHLESFKTIENVRKTKFELADALPDSGLLFLNFDNDIIKNAGHPHAAVAYGIDDRSGYYITDLKITEKGSEFTVHAPNGQSCTYRTQLIGRHNVVNICGAIAVANSLGISLEELKPAVRRLESVPHRLQLINKGEYTIIDDAYNSNPSGTKAALEALSMTEGMKILVTPGMIELGEMEYALNKEFGKNAAEVCDFAVLVGEKQTKAIYDGLTEAGYPSEKIYVAHDLNDAMQKVYALTSHGKRKIILLENDLPDNY